MSAENKPIIKYDTKWTVYAKRADFFGIAEKFGIDPVVARVIRNRDIITDEEIESYLNGDTESLSDPLLMKDMEKGCNILFDKIKTEKKIRIVSDYDVDGVSSNYILYRGINRVFNKLHGKDAGALLDYDIPHRIKDGYGINNRIVDKAYNDGVDTIITCDNGISAGDVTKHAKDCGMTVIVTDHHDVPFDLDGDGNRVYKIPYADAVIDYKQPCCKYPYKELCGAGVVYKMMQQLYKMAGIPENEIDEFTEILGVATVCDVMNLVGENRIFVKRALKSLQHSSNCGLRALIRESGREEKKLSAFDLGFIIGPCINAAGRLGDATLSLEFLLEQDSTSAQEKAVELVNINNERKGMTEQGFKKAVELLEEGADEASLADKILVIYLPEIHESIVGIIAGRIKEKYNRPVMLFTDSSTQGIIKGSGRSIDGYDMISEINKCSEYFTQYGGHVMAAGFSMEKEKLNDLREKLNEECLLDENALTPKLRIDVAMPFDYITFKLTEQLNRLEPFGKGNEKPVFAQSGASIKKATVLGKNKNVLRVTFVMNNGKTIEGLSFEPETFISNIKVWFGTDECDKILKGVPNNVLIDVAYYPEINEFNGRRNLQLRISDYRKHSEEKA